jgi:pimeloyl-ACP methyl ester carboxylesterase
MKIAIAEVGNLELAYEVFGEPSDPAVLLLMGNSAPGLVWPDAFCTAIAGAGYQVIRYDQRDTGLSSYFDFATTPYSLRDLVDDAFALLDRLGITAAHLVGLSQGGNTAYLAALAAPQRVLSVVTMMSSPDLGPKNDAFSGRPELPGQLPRPAADYVSAVIELNAKLPAGGEETARLFMENFRLAAGPQSAFDEIFWLELGRAVASRKRGGEAAKMANHSNHSKAQMATPPLSEADLSRIVTPCLVIHGSGDPIFPVAHAEWTVEKLKNSEFRMIPDMGHALDPAYFGIVSEAVVDFLGRRAQEKQ